MYIYIYICISLSNIYIYIHRCIHYFVTKHTISCTTILMLITIITNLSALVGAWLARGPLELRI